MATINYLADDGSTVVFVDPAGVQAAVDAAVEAIPAPAAPTVSEVDVKESDGTEQTFTDEAPATETAPAE